MNQACAICQRLYWEEDDFLTNKVAFICPECSKTGYRVKMVYSDNTLLEEVKE